MKVYKKLSNKGSHISVAKDLNISEGHVGRIANFLVEEYFLVLESLKTHSKEYVITKRVPTLKILYDILISNKRDDGGSSDSGIHILQYKSNLQSEITDRVISSCKMITPKGTTKYLFPPNKNLKLSFNLVIHDGKYRKSVMFYLNRIHLTVNELAISDEIIDERIRRIAYNVQRFFKIKIDLPKPVGRKQEIAFVPREQFLVDKLDEITFEINSPVGTIRGDKSGDPRILDGKEIEFTNKDLAMSYVKIIPVVHMLEGAVINHHSRVALLEQDIVDVKGMLSEIKPTLDKIVTYIENEEIFRKKSANKSSEDTSYIY